MRSEAGPPPIAPAPAGADRPFWSVMIPAYEPGPWLAETIRSVLQQDPGPGRMQIAVVDDRSPTVDVHALVRDVAGERVEYHRNPDNLRLARNWNRSIELARGRWVHILHQDDLVLPGFYEALERGAAAAPAAGVLYCQHAVIDPGGRWLYISPLERPSPGLLEGWLGLIAQQQRVQCPAVVVRRDVYEELGGFRADLHFVLDWEMWVRIAARYPWWFEPTILACYRHHDSSETARLRQDGRDVEDILRGIEIVRGGLPQELRGGAGAGLRALGVSETMKQVRLAIPDNRLRDALRLLRLARAIDPARRHVRSFLPYYRWIAKAYLKGRLGRPAALGGEQS